MNLLCPSKSPHFVDTIEFILWILWTSNWLHFQPLPTFCQNLVISAKISVIVKNLLVMRNIKLCKLPHVKRTLLQRKLFCNPRRGKGARHGSTQISPADWRAVRNLGDFQKPRKLLFSHPAIFRTWSDLPRFLYLSLCLDSVVSLGTGFLCILATCNWSPKISSATSKPTWLSSSHICKSQDKNLSCLNACFSPVQSKQFVDHQEVSVIPKVSATVTGQRGCWATWIFSSYVWH